VSAAVPAVFLGTSDFAADVLRVLAASGQRPQLVVTPPDRRSGRGRKVSPPAAAVVAGELGIELYQTSSVNDPASREAVLASGPELGVVCAFGQLIGADLLAALPMLNAHPSLLPRWRGAAPIQRAIMAGDAESGVTIMRMEEGLDTGPMCKVGKVPIRPETTAQSLHDELAALGARLMTEVLSQDKIDCVAQPEEGVTYAKKIDKAEARIDFAGSAVAVRNHIHGLSPFPGAWFEVNGTRIKVLNCETTNAAAAPGTFADDALTIGCGNGAVRLLRLQREGKGAMDAETFLRGFAIPAGSKAS